MRDCDPFFAHKVALVLDRLARTHGVPNSFNLAELVLELNPPSRAGCRLELGKLFRSADARALVAGRLRHCRLGAYRPSDDPRSRPHMVVDLS